MQFSRRIYGDFFASPHHRVAASQNWHAACLIKMRMPKSIANLKIFGGNMEGINTAVVVTTYLSYVILSVVLTVWVAQTLHKNGRVFLVEVFNNNEALADSVNHLLVVGFYLINFGYVSLALKMSQYPENAAQGIESLSWKIGLVLLVLGGMHFMNLLIFQRIHRRPKLNRNYPPMPRAESVVS